MNYERRKNYELWIMNYGCLEAELIVAASSLIHKSLIHKS
jgi:hypothetical protein